MEAAETRYSLRGRLLRLLLVPVLTLFAISDLICYAFAAHYANSVYDAWLFDSASSLIVALKRTPQGMQLDLHGSSEDLFRWDVVDTTYYQVSTPTGVIAGRRDMPPLPAQTQSFRNARVFDAVLEGRSVRVARVDVPGATFGEPVAIQVAETTTKREELARRLLAGIVIPQIILLAVAAVALWIGIRRSLRPLDELTAGVEAQDHRQIKPLDVSGSPDEVTPLLRALNHLLGRVDTLVAAQQRFVADAAHQLRTPVTALRLNIEQALREPTFEGVTRLLTESHRAVDRMARLSNQLLVLARSGPEAIVATPLRTVELVALVQEVGARWVPRALAKRIELSLNPGQPRVEILGNAELLGEMVDNLLDNAIQYHPGGGSVHIRVDAKPEPRLEIEDDGPGIPPEMRDEVFKRFRRGAAARGTGNGLGLAIVEEIVTVHGARIALDAPAGAAHGLLVTIAFPQPTAAAQALRAGPGVMRTALASRTEPAAR